MFNFNNNDTSTLLLLVVLGFLIWYIAKPKNNIKDTSQSNKDNITHYNNSEDFIQNKQDPVKNHHKSDEQFTNEDNIQYEEPTAQWDVFTSDPKELYNVSELPNTQLEFFTNKSNESPSPQTDSINGYENGSNLFELSNSSYDINKIEKFSVEDNITSQPSQVISKPNLNNINEFSSFDGNYNDSGGADINYAFQSPIPTTDTVISAIDINKQNVQNYNAKDFLPKEINDQWFNTDFSQARTNLDDDKLINTDRFVIGINTVGQSLKNASYDIRGTIANPKYSVSPWNNSTYEPDYNIKPLC